MPADSQDIAEVTEALTKNFDEFRATNDKRIEEIII